jgi:hypothetical protein
MGYGNGDCGMKAQIDELTLRHLPAEDRETAVAVLTALRKVDEGCDISLMMGDACFVIPISIVNMLRDALSLAACDESVRIAMISHRNLVTVNQLENLVGLDHKKARSFLASRGVSPTTSGRNAPYSLEQALEVLMTDKPE